jgi:hypothetical protein
MLYAEPGSRALSGEGRVLVCSQVPLKENPKLTCTSSTNDTLRPHPRPRPYKPNPDHFAPASQKTLNQHPNGHRPPRHRHRLREAHNLP